jgi:hypothetical protein
VAKCTMSSLAPAIRLAGWVPSPGPRNFTSLEVACNVPSFCARPARPHITPLSLAAHEANGAVFRSVALISSPVISLDIVALPHLNS